MIKEQTFAANQNSEFGKYETTPYKTCYSTLVDASLITLVPNGIWIFGQRDNKR